MQALEKVELDRSLTDFIAQWKNKKGKEIPILHKVQEVYGYVPRNIAMEVARVAGIPLAKIYGIITFYHLFKLQKSGKYKISVCMGTACYLKGGENLLDEFEKILGIGLDATTEDGMFSMETVRCIGCCGLAPAVVINGKVYGNLKKEDIAGIIGEYKKEAQA
ncbi:MAG: NAD(P)H-dependent oxidoreductase subunit E [Spirochaetes bacterium]|nr:NAD(P)H-dependent oxidoreductase subunit E [Spirochaetota bacterium]